MTILFSEKDCFQYQNLHQLKILVTQVKPGGKKSYLAGKNGYSAEKNGYPVEKSCYFLSFYKTSTRKLNKNAILENYALFKKNNFAHCVYGIKIHHIYSIKFL